MGYRIQEGNGCLEVCSETKMAFDVNLDHRIAKAISVPLDTMNTLGLRGSEVAYSTTIGCWGRYTYHKRVMLNDAKARGVWICTGKVDDLYLNRADIGGLVLLKTVVDNVMTDEETTIGALIMAQSKIKNIRGELPKINELGLGNKSVVPEKLEKILKK